MTREQLWAIAPMGARPVIERWFQRGAKCAVYLNKALDSYRGGHRQFVSFGDEASQLGPGDAPLRVPDWGEHSTNWAYRLEEVVE